MAEETRTPAEESHAQETPTDAPAAESAVSSTASSAASAIIGDPGPDFEPGNEREGFQAPEAAPEPQGAVALELGWEEDTVRSILTAKGAAIHAVAGVTEEDWLYTEADLMAIAPPLTRILNRYPVTQAAAGTGDELALVIGLGGYGIRSYTERRAVLEELAEQPEVPVSGRAAEPGTGPTPPQPEGQEDTWTTDQ